jgi:hypothetical protein
VTLYQSIVICSQILKIVIMNIICKVVDRQFKCYDVFFEMQISHDLVETH